MSWRTRQAVSTPLRFELFGRLRITGDDRAELALESHKAAELLAYLLVHRDRPHQRERLANELWDDSSTRNSLKHLRHALWKLHAAAPELRSLVRAEREWIQFDAREAWIDVASFDRAFAEARDRTGFDLDPIGADRLRDAASLYTSDLLSGWDAEWCLLERERLQNVYLLLLDKLMDYALHQGLPEIGLGYGATSTGLDPARESTHQRLMQLHYACGNRTAALRQYDRCARHLMNDLGVRPGRRTDALREAIEADRGAHAVASLRSRSRPSDEDDAYLTDSEATLGPLDDEVAIRIERTPRHH